MIYEPKDENSPQLREFISDLEASGNHYVRAVAAGEEMQCALKSQLQRMFVPVTGVVLPDDIVTTADVDTFVISRDIFDELWANQGKVSILQYDNTLFTGKTFAMTFIAMKASMWWQLIREVCICIRVR